MAFGEANCTVTLTNCVPGVCYSFRDATSTVERRTALHSVVTGEQAAALLRLRASLRPRDAGGRTPLELAAEEGRDDVEEVLRLASAGAAAAATGHAEEGDQR